LSGELVGEDTQKHGGGDEEKGGVKERESEREEGEGGKEGGTERGKEGMYVCMYIVYCIYSIVSMYVYGLSRRWIS
jgi:hypothetical protein